MGFYAGKGGLPELRFGARVGGASQHHFFKIGLGSIEFMVDLVSKGIPHVEQFFLDSFLFFLCLKHLQIFNSQILLYDYFNGKLP